jgi:hypothetical protein
MGKSVTVIDMTLLKRLVSEFETLISSISTLEADEKLTRDDYVVELSKLTGIASGIVTESTLLVYDVQAIVKAATTVSYPKNYLEQLLNSAGLGAPKSSTGSTGSGNGSSGSSGNSSN